MDIRIEAQSVTLLPEWEEKINAEVARLEKHAPGLLHHFRVNIIGTHHHKRGLFEVHLAASVPQDVILVKHTGEQVSPLLVECFDILDRQIRAYNRQRQNVVKSHEGHSTGRVIRVLSDQGYGFLESAGGEEVYFHQNALKGVDIHEITVGIPVLYEQEMGDKGPQATWVRPIGRGEL